MKTWRHPNDDAQFDAALGRAGVLPPEKPLARSNTIHGRQVTATAAVGTAQDILVGLAPPRRGQVGIAGGDAHRGRRDGVGQGRLPAQRVAGTAMRSWRACQIWSPGGAPMCYQIGTSASRGALFP